MVDLNGRDLPGDGGGHHRRGRHRPRGAGDHLRRDRPRLQLLRGGGHLLPARRALRGRLSDNGLYRGGRRPDPLHCDARAGGEVDARLARLVGQGRGPARPRSPSPSRWSSPSRPRTSSMRSSRPRRRASSGSGSSSRDPSRPRWSCWPWSSPLAILGAMMLAKVERSGQP